MLLNDCFSDGSLSISTKKNTVRQNDRSLTIILQSFEDVHQPRIVAVFFRRSTTISFKASIFFARNAIAPVLHGKGRICNDVIKALKNRAVSLVEILRI